MTEGELEERNEETPEEPENEALPGEGTGKAGSAAEENAESPAPRPEAEPPAGSPGDERSPAVPGAAEVPGGRLIHASERPAVVRWFEDQIEVNVVRRLTGSARDPGEGKDEGMSDGEAEELLAESLFIYKRMEGK